MSDNKNNEVREDGEMLWGCISDRIDKICKESERLNWDEIEDMISEALEVEDGAVSSDLFFRLYQFLFRLHYRLKSMTSPEPFNKIYTTTRLENHQYATFYQINNYDYKMFRWARSKGFNDYTTNFYLLIPKDSLTEQEQQQFEQKLDKKI